MGPSAGTATLTQREPPDDLSGRYCTATNGRGPSPALSLGEEAGEAMRQWAALMTSRRVLTKYTMDEEPFLSARFLTYTKEYVVSDAMGITRDWTSLSWILFPANYRYSKRQPSCKDEVSIFFFGRGLVGLLTSARLSKHTLNVSTLPTALPNTRWARRLGDSSRKVEWSLFYTGGLSQITNR